jgi:hypothetical protein
VKPANHRGNRVDRRIARNQNDQRKVVAVTRKCGGRTPAAVFRPDSSALGFIASRASTCTSIIADALGARITGGCQRTAGSRDIGHGGAELGCLVQVLAASQVA